MGLLSHIYTLVLLCDIHISFVFIDIQPAAARNPASMYVCHVLATSVVPYRNLTPSFLVDIRVSIITAPEISASLLDQLTSNLPIGI